MVKSYTKPTLQNLSTDSKCSNAAVECSILKQETINNILAYSKALKVYPIKGKMSIDVILN